MLPEPIVLILAAYGSSSCSNLVNHELAIGAGRGKHGIKAEAVRRVGSR